MSNGVDSELRPRCCHILKWPDFQGYGFNLHAEKGKAGQFIGKVDEDSPASSAGLKSGDRIVEVNGVNIGNENHQQVVKRVKTGGDQTELLVVDEETDQHYKHEKKVVRGDLPEVLHLRTELRTGQEEPPPMPAQEPETNTEEEHVTTVIAPVIAPVIEPEPVNNNNEDDEHQPRLCHIKKWHDFQGFGFNLHAEKNKLGQYIGKVDDDSPAETAGLKENDRIIEVNGDNVEQEQHQVVISKIKSGGEETKLLVVDPKTDAYYKEKGISITGTMAQVLYQVTPHRALPENGNKDPEVITTASDVIEAENEPEYEPPSSHTIEDDIPEEPELTTPDPEVSEITELESLPPPAPEVLAPQEHETENAHEPEVVASQEPEVSALPEPITSEPSAQEEHENSHNIYENDTTETIPEREPTPEPEPDHAATYENVESTVITNDEPDNSSFEPVVSNGNHDYENASEVNNHTVTETITTETVQSTETVPQVENGHPASEEKAPEPESPPPAYNYKAEPAPVPVSAETDGRPAGMSAKEYLESLKKKKRPDPRTQRMDFKLKHDLFQKM